MLELPETKNEVSNRYRDVKDILNDPRVEEELIEFDPDPDVQYAPDYTAHPAIPMTYLDGETVHIDVEIGPLIRAMWDVGISTMYCCQGHDVPAGQDPNAWAWAGFKGYIMMPRTSKSLGFVQAIVSNFLTKTDRGYSWDIEFIENPHHGSILVIRFPKNDLEELVKFTRFVAGSGLL